MFWLVITFSATAAIYASVGFGGGSTYTALLVLTDTDYRLVPVLSLLCNIIVVSGNTAAFARKGWLNKDLAIPLALASVPMAWLGGATPIERETFLLVLGLALIAAGMLLIRQNPPSAEDEPRVARARLWVIGPLAGGGLGYLAGLVGIGGGIFLAPALHLARVASPKTVASTASLFILVNSLAGIAGQGFKLEGTLRGEDVLPYGWLLLAVLVGGRIGSYTGVRVFSGNTMRKLTGGLVLVVGFRLLWTWWPA